MAAGKGRFRWNCAVSRCSDRAGTQCRQIEHRLGWTAWLRKLGRREVRPRGKVRTRSRSGCWRKQQGGQVVPSRVHDLFSQAMRAQKRKRCDRRCPSICCARPGPMVWRPSTKPGETILSASCRCYGGCPPFAQKAADTPVPSSDRKPLLRGGKPGSILAQRPP